jgi:hypothetical protein
MDATEPPRGTRWAAGRPWASLLVCLGLVTLQVIGWLPLFLLGVRYHLDGRAMALLTVPMAIWLFLPLGAVYGLYIGMMPQRAPGGGVLRGAGVVANAVYLLFAILIWIGTFSGILSV